MAKKKSKHKKKSGGRKKARRNPSGTPRVLVVTGNPGSGHMAKHKKKKSGGRKHHRKNPGHKKKGHHRRRRRNSAGFFMKLAGLVALGIGSGALAFAVPEMANLRGAMAYAPGGALIVGGAVAAKKHPLAGLAVSVGAGAGMLAPWAASKILPSPQHTQEAVIEALGNRVDAARMAAVIDGMGESGHAYRDRDYGSPLEQRADMLTRGY